MTFQVCTEIFKTAFFSKLNVSSSLNCSSHNFEIIHVYFVCLCAMFCSDVTEFLLFAKYSTVVHKVLPLGCKIHS